MQSERLTLVCLVKASPVLTSQPREGMCVAGVRIDRVPTWVRLWPIPFRHLEHEQQFRKYQEISVEAVPAKGDSRSESWTPNVDSIELRRFIGTGPNRDWSERRELVHGLDIHSMCDLLAMQKSGATVPPSLGVVKVRGKPQLGITRRDAAQTQEWADRANRIVAAPSLFDTHDRVPPYPMCPWRFRYQYQCMSAHCKGHDQTIVDWEIDALWRKVSDRTAEADWQEMIRQKFIDELWSDNKDSLLFVGNQHRHRQSFLVLGVFWPPARSAIQPSLL